MRTIRGNLWHRHPGVRSGVQLTVGERAADALRNGMGSWGFVIAALLFLAGWTVGNGRHDYETNLETDRLAHAVHDPALAIAERVGAPHPTPGGGEADGS